MTRQQEYGEYFTPTEHIQEYFKQIPLEVLLNTSLKVLEPSCGSGSFIIELIKLRIQHNIPNPSHNIYAFEYHSDNIQKYINFCNEHNIQPFFINIGDTLAFDFEDLSFDIILGNPPFIS